MLVVAVEVEERTIHDLTGLIYDRMFTSFRCLLFQSAGQRRKEGGTK
jgi:hypothetical protein